MSLDESQVEKIAHLARLSITSEDAVQVASDLSRILELVEKMEACPTDAVEPMAHPLDAVQHLRADKVTESDQRETFQAIAPSVENGHYLVPKVLE